MPLAVCVCVRPQLSEHEFRCSVFNGLISDYIPFTGILPVFDVNIRIQNVESVLKGYM